MQVRDKKLAIAKVTWQKFHARYAMEESRIFEKEKDVIAKETTPEDTMHTLSMALSQGDWSHSVFFSPYLPACARTLYQSGNISFHQLCTLLERRQTFSHFPHKRTFRILDDANEFTEEAIQYLFPFLLSHKYLRSLNPDELQNLKNLITELPLSEQIIYTTEQGVLANSDEDTLGQSLISMGTIISDKSPGHLVHLSTGVFDAIGLVRFGLDDYVRPIHRLCSQGIDDIDDGVRKYARLTALSYPGTTAYGNIHGFQSVTPFEATSHDKYHSMVMSSIPNPIKQAIRRLIDLARVHGGHKWSKEIWTWVDCELVYCISHHKEISQTPRNARYNTELFCKALMTGNNTFIQVGKYSSLMIQNHATPALIFMLIDMIKNRKAWAQLDINPDYLTHDFKYYYELIQQIYDTIRHDPPLIQALKCQTFFTLSSDDAITNPLDRFAVEAGNINSAQELILANLQLKKLKKTDGKSPAYLHNTIILSLLDGYTPEENMQKLHQFRQVRDSQTMQRGQSVVRANADSLQLTAISMARSHYSLWQNPGAPYSASAPTHIAVNGVKTAF